MSQWMMIGHISQWMMIGQEAATTGHSHSSTLGSTTTAEGTDSFTD